MADGHGGVAVYQQHGSGLTYNVAASYDDCFLACYWDVAAFENLNDPSRGAWNQTGTLGGEETDVHWMKAVHILRRINCHEDLLGIHLWRQGKLHQDAVDFVPPVQILNQAKQFGGRNGVRWGVLLAVDAQFFAALDLAANIDFRGRIVAH